MGAGASLYTSPDPYAYDAALQQLAAPEDTFRKSFSEDAETMVDLEVCAGRAAAGDPHTHTHHPPRVWTSRR